ncbi:radical SAM/SPASM domain-containing protein [Streptomyces sp. CC224B]|uniref:radical SAM/SPASM domain-containing protein n=1 Tax=Streptomyces sp. CC224B TaxID=3044571 RepID=UPI0024A8534F|nr:radical SAM/SPASM domain-containing protein [Streptomyces sp. CC224B]
MTAPTTPTGLHAIELEITGGCQLTCTHCLSESSPQGTHGRMTVGDWQQVITDAAALGIPQVQLIGGEPTLYPYWVDLLDLALGLNLHVEVFSNLYHVRPAWWTVFEQDGVSLATSYYSDDPAEHDRITQRPGSHQRTRTNIQEAQRRGIPLRVGILHIQPGQRVQQARADIEAMGINDIQMDRVRAVGRAVMGSDGPSAAELCGRCGINRAAILPSGDLTLCVLSRFMPVGNVRVTPLADLIDGPLWRDARSKIPPLSPTACQPDGSDCNPANTPACLPKFPVAPIYLTTQDGTR